jgi:hypothetical protein
VTLAVLLLEQLPPAVLVVEQVGPFDADTLPGPAYCNVQVIAWPGASISCTLRPPSVVQPTGIAVIEQPAKPPLQPKTVSAPLLLNAENSGLENPP